MCPTEALCYARCKGGKKLCITWCIPHRTNQFIQMYKEEATKISAINKPSQRKWCIDFNQRTSSMI